MILVNPKSKQINDQFFAVSLKVEILTGDLIIPNL